MGTAPYTRLTDGADEPVISCPRLNGPSVGLFSWASTACSREVLPSLIALETKVVPALQREHGNRQAFIAAGDRGTSHHLWQTGRKKHFPVLRVKPFHHLSSQGTIGNLNSQSAVDHRMAVQLGADPLWFRAAAPPLASVPASHRNASGKCKKGHRQNEIQKRFPNQSSPCPSNYGPDRAKAKTNKGDRYSYRSSAPSDALNS